MRFKYFQATLFTLLTVSAQAALLTKTNDYIVAKDQVIGSEQWVVANAAHVEGTITDDLFVGTTEELLLSGTMEGNVWGYSYTDAKVSGTCRRNVRVFAPTLRIEGDIDGNLMAMGATISIATNATVSGDAYLKASQIIVEGHVGGNLHVTAMQTATVSGRIDGNATITAPEIILPDDARVGGNLTYTMGKELIPSEEVVSGQMVRIAPESPYSSARITQHTFLFLGALLTGVAFISLFPMTTAMASLLARKSPLKCFVVGSVSLVLLFFFAVVSVNSIIGLPLGLVTLAAGGILVYTSRIIIGLMLGSMVLKGANTSAGRVLLAMATGLAIIYFFTFIPNGVGRMIQVIVACIGVGAMLLALLQKRRLIIQVPEELKQLEALKKESHNPTEESP